MDVLDHLDLIGVGLNINVAARDMPKSLRHCGASLLIISGRAIDLNELLAVTAGRLHRVMSLRDEPPFSQMLREYDTHHALNGRRVSIANHDEAPITGSCEGVDRDGRLLVRTRSGLARVVAGHVVALQR